MRRRIIDERDAGFGCEVRSIYYGLRVCGEGTESKIKLPWTSANMLGVWMSTKMLNGSVNLSAEDGWDNPADFNCCLLLAGVGDASR